MSSQDFFARARESARVPTGAYPSTSEVKNVSEQKIEKQIQGAGLTAPRLRPEDIDKVIASATYTRLPSGKVMVCELTLINGYTVRGESACVSPENFNVQIGEEISFKNAREKVWELEGYLLQQRLHAQRQ